MMSDINDEIATALAKAFDEYFPLYALAVQLPEDRKKAVLKLVAEKSEVVKAIDKQREATGE